MLGDEAAELVRMSAHLPRDLLPALRAGARECEAAKRRGRGKGEEGAAQTLYSMKSGFDVLWSRESMVSACAWTKRMS